MSDMAYIPRTDVVSSVMPLGAAWGSEPGCNRSVKRVPGGIVRIGGLTIVGVLVVWSRI